MDNFLYCPIIKGKLNDIKAMAFVAHSVADSAKALYELPPFKPTDDAEVVLARFASRLGSLVGKRPCYVDFPVLRPGARTSNREPALEAGLGQLNAVGINYEPVFGFDRDDAMWNLVIRQAARSGGMLLRLDSDDLEFQDETIDRIVELRHQGLDLRTVDVMIDRRFLGSKQTAMAAASETADFIDRLVTAVRIRNVLVAGSSAPKSVAEIERDTCGTVARHELTFWASLATERLPIRPIYSDYGVIHPEFSDLTLSTHINGKIRYTQGGNLYIHRGHSLRQGNKFDQYRTLSSEVASSSHYQGSTFSYGDRYIYDCATGHAGTGNPGTWVLVDQNHHISYTAAQLQRLTALVEQGLPAEEILVRA